MNWLLIFMLIMSHNQLRAEAGVCPLAPDTQLMQRAENRAEYLAATHQLDNHAGFWGEIGELGTWYLLGENTGRSYGTRQDLMLAFEASPPHYAGIVDARYEGIGVGTEYGTDGALYVAVWFVDRDNLACYAEKGPS